MDDTVAETIVAVATVTAMVVVVVLCVCAWIMVRNRQTLAQLRRELEAERARVVRLPESTRPASQMFAARPLTCQFGLWECETEATVRTYLGGGYLDKGVLVTCHHVLEMQRENTQLWLSNSIGEMFKLFDSKPVVEQAPCDGWTLIASDIVVMPKPLNISSLTEAKVGPVDGKLMVTCMSTLRKGQASVGMLEVAPIEHGFATLVYHGSTQAGMSGGVYTSGVHVVGVHAGGGTVNYGFATSFIRVRIERFLRTTKDGVERRPESSEYEAIRRMLKVARKGDWDVHNIGNPDEVELRVNGRYFSIDREEWARMQEEMYEEEDTSYWEDKLPELEPTRMGRRARARYNRPQFQRADLGIWEQEWEAIQRCPEGIRCEEDDSESDLSELSENSSGSQKQAGPSAAVINLIESQHQDILQIQRTQTSLSEGLVGLTQALTQLSSRLESMSTSEQKPLQDFMSSVSVKLERLLENSSKPIQYALTDQPSSHMNQVSTSGSISALPDSTQPPQQDLGTSKSGVQLVPRWDTMALDIQKLTAWRSLNRSSHPSFSGLQSRYLQSMNLTPGQASVVLQQVLKVEKAEKRKRQRAQAKAAKAKVSDLPMVVRKPTTVAQDLPVAEKPKGHSVMPVSCDVPMMTSSSSSKMSPTSCQSSRREDIV